MLRMSALRLAILMMVVGLAAAFSGCSSFKVKTPLVADYAKLDTLDLSLASRDHIQLAIGSPQSTGTHQQGDKIGDLAFYQGFAGIVTVDTAKYDSGTVLVTYSGGEVEQLLYFNSSINDPEIDFSRDLPVKELAENLVLGESSVEQVYSVLGPPSYSGRRSNNREGIVHSIVIYDASKTESDAAIKEKWVLIGYDDAGIVQDVMWVSSYEADIEEWGDIQPQKFRQLARIIHETA